jgi:ADP-ribosylglycohydrolase
VENRPLVADLRDKFLGSILGCAVGDALGAPFEGAPPSANRFSSRAEIRYREIPGYPLGQYTDDTQLTLAIIRAICRAGHIDGASIAEEFVTLWNTGEIVGPGASCSEAVRNMVALGMSWEDAGTPPGRAGNGTAMRAAPIGLWNYSHPERIARDAEISSIITHKDPRSVSGTIAVAKAVAMCVNDQLVAPEEFLGSISDEVRKVSELFADSIDELGSWLGLAPPDALTMIYAAGEPDMGSRQPGWVTAYVIPTVLCALYCFLNMPHDFMAGVTGSICAGGDADTVAAITGAISGAYNGISGIPVRLVDTLKNSGEIIELAEKFFNVTVSQD